MENTPEEIERKPTEASKQFLGKWRKEILFSFTAANLVGWSVLTGMDFASGHNETILLKGVVAGCFAAATVLKGISMFRENRLSKNQVTQLNGPDKK